ncbi:hypothetical protein [Nocardiopsis prasina]|uniref:hypothetical protein n=1 Tax=Nocardiopsis prasina TaxID=2015 RepID=UPI00034AAFAD|nr:hypothetical protein [Nocardiopsis prasina]
MLDTAVEFHCQERDPHQEGLTRYELGLTWVAAGDPLKAIPHLERAVKLLGENNDPFRRGRAAGALAGARSSPTPGGGSAGSPTP